MDKAEFNTKVQELLNAASLDVPAVLKLIEDVLKDDSKGATRAFVALTEAIVQTKLFKGAVQATDFFAKHCEGLKGIEIAMMREVIRRSANTTEEKLFIDSIGLNSAIATAIVSRLSVLLAITPGCYVSSQSWGFGQVQSIDAFYGKVIIDFEGKKNHAMSLAVASQNLSIANDDHIMTQYLKDKAAILEEAEKHPAEIIRKMLRSYGPLPIQRIADRLASVGIVPASKWKGFWESARRAIKADKKKQVEIPAKRTDPLTIVEKEEAYDEAWATKFKKERDIKAIYDKVLLMIAEKVDFLHVEPLKEAIANRLNFALKGCKNTDYPRYAQLACLLRVLGLSTMEERKEQAELILTIDDEQNNLLASVRGLSNRDATELFSFLLAIAPEHKDVLIQHIDRFGSTALSALIALCKEDADVQAHVCGLLKRTIQPKESNNKLCTLIVWAIRNAADYKQWRLMPKTYDLVSMAIHIIEQRLTGEDLKMRNVLQGFFDSAKWLEATTNALEPFERRVVFERIQASTSWDTISQRNILVRMVRFDAELASLRRAVKAQMEIQHLTSYRSLAAFKFDYERLVNVDIPENAREIATARSYGDLRENAEYQMAKEKQHTLLSKQEQMNRTLRTMKATDFASATTETVQMGTSVTIDLNGQMMRYTILGELDSDEALKIISCRSRLAEGLLNKRVGDSATIPTENGMTSVKVVAIEALDEAVKAWLAAIPTA